MNKRVLILMIVIISLTGCTGNNIADKSLEQGKLALARRDYCTAKASFELSVDNGLKKDKEKVEELILIIDNYFKSKEVFLEKDIFNVKKYLNSIGDSYKEYNIRDEIDSLKGEIRDYEESKNDLSEYLDTLEGLIEEENTVMAFKIIKKIEKMDLSDEEENRFLDLIDSYNRFIIESESKEKIIHKEKESNVVEIEEIEKLYYVVDLDMELNEEDMFKYYSDRGEIPFYIVDLDTNEEFIFDPNGFLDDWFDIRIHLWYDWCL